MLEILKKISHIQFLRSCVRTILRIFYEKLKSNFINIVYRF